MLVAVQLSVPGSYLPPVFKACQTIIARPRRSFRYPSRLQYERLGQPGALVVLVAVQLSVLGLYLPPVFKKLHSQEFRPKRSFHCRSTPPYETTGQRARWWCPWLSSYR